MARWLNQTRRKGRTNRVRTLSNNPERGSNRWGGYKAVTRAQRGIRRLMKVDPNNAQGTPASQLKLTTPGMTDNGASKGVSVVGHTEDRAVNSGTSQTGRPKKIRDRSRNTSLKKR